MAIAEDAATVLEQFIHDGQVLSDEARHGAVLTFSSRKSSRRNHTFVRGSAGQGCANPGASVGATTTRQQPPEIHQAQRQPAAESQRRPVLQGDPGQLRKSADTAGREDWPCRESCFTGKGKRRWEAAGLLIRNLVGPPCKATRH